MFADNSFDLVQMRLFASVLKGDQWIKTLKELKRVCRPGGMIQLLEVDYKVGLMFKIIQRVSGTKLKPI
jgi:ubiquinone/menaquinone biosynthesis C-methylase UbiE